MQPVADGASAETILANGMSVVRTGDLATVEKMAATLTAKAGGFAVAGSGGADADRGAVRVPAAGGENPDAGKGDRRRPWRRPHWSPRPRGRRMRRSALSPRR